MHNNFPFVFINVSEEIIEIFSYNLLSEQVYIMHELSQNVNQLKIQSIFLSFLHNCEKGKKSHMNFLNWTKIKVHFAAMVFYLVPCCLILLLFKSMFCSVQNRKFEITLLWQNMKQNILSF